MYGRPIDDSSIVVLSFFCFINTRRQSSSLIMGERKVLNKYIPADFDPSLVPRGNKLSKKDGTVPVRMMLPFTIQCSSCNTFLYRGRKFNAKKENMDGPEGRYLGKIQRYRFYFKCNHCSRTLTILTDPKNTDYEMESGGTRNYDVHKDKEQMEDEVAAEKEQEEKEDPMRALENRVLDSQREMADWDNLEEIQAINKKHLQLTSSADVFAALDAKRDAASLDATIVLEGLNEHGLTQEEEALVKSIKFGPKRHDTTNTVVRLSEADEQREEERRKMEMELIRQRQLNLEGKLTAKNSMKASLLPIIKRKKIVKREEENNSGKKQKIAQTATKANCDFKPSPVAAQSGGLAGLMASYGSSSDSN
jgi:hypothetical protein